jgi:hypothetical protein
LSKSIGRNQSQRGVAISLLFNRNILVILQIVKNKARVLEQVYSDIVDAWCLSDSMPGPNSGKGVPLPPAQAGRVEFPNLVGSWC